MNAVMPLALSNGVGLFCFIVALRKSNRRLPPFTPGMCFIFINSCSSIVGYEKIYFRTVIDCTYVLCITAIPAFLHFAFEKVPVNLQLFDI